MADKRIETRIREHYQAESGEWLVEKGKVKEAKLLKEACETIEQLRRNVTRLEQAIHGRLNENWKKDTELKQREKAVEETEKRLRDRIESAINGLQYMRENL